MIIRLILAALCAAMIAVPAAAEWRRAETENFVVYADLEPEGLTDYARYLERFDAVLRQFTGVGSEAAEVKFTIYLVPNMTRLQRRIGLGGYASGIYIADMRGPYAVAPVYELQTVFHEYVHHFMLHNAPATYPGWYREGFAEFFSTVAFDEDGHAQLGQFPRGRASLLEYSRRYRFRHMLADTGETNPAAIYAQGWLLVHHSIYHDHTRQLLAQYLQLINSGQSTAEAYEATFARLGDPLEDELQDYGRGRMPTSLTSQSFADDAEVTIHELSEEEAEVELLYPRRQDYLEREVLNAARKYPDNPQAWAEVAQLRLAQDRIGEAIEAADTALAIDPDHDEANVFKGTALLRQAVATGDADDPRWEEARALFVRSNQSNPRYPIALLRYYQSFPDPESRPDYALAGLEQAFLFVPQNSETRLLLSLEFLRQGRFAEARILAMPMALSAHATNAFSQAARTVMERAEARNSDAVIDDLDPLEFLDE